MSVKSVLFNASNSNAGQWIQVIFHCLHAKAAYKIAKVIRLSGMMLVVFVKEELGPFIKNVAAQTIGTGLLGN